jgi:hypothetical protein
MTRELAERDRPDGARDEVDEVVSGRSPATPAWSLLSVAVAIGSLFAVAVTLAAISYLLAS